MDERIYDGSLISWYQTPKGYEGAVDAEVLGFIPGSPPDFMTVLSPKSGIIKKFIRNQDIESSRKTYCYSATGYGTSVVIRVFEV